VLLQGSFKAERFTLRPAGARGKIPGRLLSRIASNRPGFSLAHQSLTFVGVQGPGPNRSQRCSENRWRFFFGSSFNSKFKKKREACFELQFQNPPTPISHWVILEAGFLSGQIATQTQKPANFMLWGGGKLCPAPPQGGRRPGYTVEKNGRVGTQCGRLQGGGPAAD